MSVTFNGSSYLELSADLIGGGVSEAFFAWIRPRGASLTGNTAPVSAGRFGAGSELSILTIGGTSVRAQARDGIASNNAERAATLSDTWIPVLAVFASTSSRTIYVAGGSSTETTLNNTLDPGAFNRFRVGARGYENNLYFTGDIAEVAVWSGTLPDAADFTSLAGGTAPETIKSGSLIWHRQLLTHTDLAAGAAGSTPTAVGTIATGATHPISRAGAPTLSGTATVSAVTASGGFLSVASSLSGTAALSAIIASGTLGVAPGVVLVPELRNWGGSLQSGVTIPVVTVCRLDTGAQVLTLTNQVTSGAGNLSITSASLVAGTAYMVVGWNADGSQRFAAPIVAA